MEIDWHTKSIDASYANGHTRDLYNNLTAARAAILAQLRTGICRLNSYLHKINAADSVNCDCAHGLPETVPHSLFVPKVGCAASGDEGGARRVLGRRGSCVRREADEDRGEGLGT